MFYDGDYTKFKGIKEESHDLIVYHHGMEKCKSNHSFGPALRDHFLIHYILDGKGTFYVGGKSYSLHKGDGFVIFPNIVTYYEADKDNPWFYTWVGFRGINAEGLLEKAALTESNPTFHCESEVIRNAFEDLKNSENYKYSYDLRLQGILSLVLSELIEEAAIPEISIDKGCDIYIKKTLQIIETNYSQPISVESIAKSLGLNKNYFSALFKNALGMSPQQYIIKYRINKASELLQNKDLTISEISRSVGYTDPLGFSKIFKKIKGVSPKNYREV